MMLRCCQDADWYLMVAVLRSVGSAVSRFGDGFIWACPKKKVILEVKPSSRYLIACHDHLTPRVQPMTESAVGCEPMDES
jgi:hypothetical protein